MDENYNASAYENAEAYIYHIPKFTKKNSIDNTKRLLQALGEPGQSAKIIHVAGTNGKGSVCAYLNGFLLESGKTAGMFTSPHLISMNERIRINGRIVSKEEFLYGYDKVKELIQHLPEETEHPTFFEMLFLIGMCIFEKHQVEYIILETGLGGRLDATNAVLQKKAAVITKIGLDHCQYLGNSIQEIAEEKAGILKCKTPVIYLQKYKESGEVIEKKAGNLCCPMEGLDEESFFIENFKNKNIDFSYKSRYYDYITFTVPTCALYQVENISLALRTYEVLMEKEQVSIEKLQKAITHTKWEGRMEEIREGIFVDGAHNEDGMLAFLNTVEHIPCKGKRILLFSVVSDKDYQSMIKALARSPLFEKLIVVCLQDARGLQLEQLKENFSFCPKEQITFFPTVEEGVSEALSEKNQDDMVFVAGSLYLVGDVKALLRRK